MDLSKLAPDDIRVNPELHLLVQDALHKASEEELRNFNPIENKRPQDIKRDLVALSLRVIAGYQARKAEEKRDAVSDDS